MMTKLTPIDTEGDSIRELTCRVQAEYAPMPGLSVPCIGIEDRIAT